MTGTDPNSKDGHDQPAPPRWTRLLLSMLLPARYRDQQLGDLSEGFHARGARGGYREARRWYRKQVLTSLGPALRLRIRHRRHVFGNFGKGAVAMLRDLRPAFRGLMKRPLFTVFAVMSVAIGIGASTAVSSVANAVFFRAQAGVLDPDRMVDFLGPTGQSAFSYPDFLSLQAEMSSLSGVAAVRADQLNLGDDAGGVRVPGMFVSASYFDVVGVVPALGRFFRPEEDVGLGEHAVGVVSDQFWRERLGGVPDVVGSTLQVNGETVQVIGVAPSGFGGQIRGYRTNLWMPLMQQQILRRSPDFLSDRGGAGFLLFGRLAPGGSLAQARAEADAVFTRLGEQFPESYGERGAGARIVQFSPLPPDTDGPLVLAATAFGALVGLVLLVTASNVAGMLLARSASQGREVALRMAIGASRARLVSYLLAETLVLFFLGGLGGVFLAWIGTRAIDLSAFANRIPMEMDLSPDGMVMVAGLVVALVTGCIFGVGPALWATKAGVAPLLSKTGAGPARTRLRRLLVSGQIAMSLVLVSAGFVFLRSARNAAEMPRGFDSAGRYAVTVDMGVSWDGTADEASVLIRDLLEHLEGSNAFRAVALSSKIPLDGNMVLSPHFREGREEAGGGGGERMYRNAISSGYLRTLGVSMVVGRPFGDQDTRDGPRVGIVNQAYADRYGGGEPILGTRYRTSSTGELIEVIGVVENVPAGGLSMLGSPMIYMPLAQYLQRQVEVTVWEREGAEGTPATLVRMLREANPGLALGPVRGLEDLAETAMFGQRAGLAVSSALALVGLLISGLGLYGVVAFGVYSRRKEIGIRLALGAGQEVVRKQVLWDGLKLAIPGVVVGGFAAIVMAQLLRSLLYGVEAVDPVALGGVALLGLILVALASYGPAREASSIDPGVALRFE